MQRGLKGCTAALLRWETLKAYLSSEENLENNSTRILIS